MPSPDLARVTTGSSCRGSGPEPRHPPDYEPAHMDARSFSTFLDATPRSPRGQGSATSWAMRSITRCLAGLLAHAIVPMSAAQLPSHWQTQRSRSRPRLFHVVGWGVVEFGVLLLGLVVLGHVDVLDE